MKKLLLFSFLSLATFNVFFAMDEEGAAEEIELARLLEIHDDRDDAMARPYRDRDDAMARPYRDNIVVLQPLEHRPYVDNRVEDDLFGGFFVFRRPLGGLFVLRRPVDG